MSPFCLYKEPTSLEPLFNGCRRPAVRSRKKVEIIRSIPSSRGERSRDGSAKPVSPAVARRGDYDNAFRRLRKGLPDIGGLDSAEGNLLLAIAARATHHQEEYDKATKAARESGADLALLSSR